MIQYKTIEYLAYLIKDAKLNGNPKPIVLIGAGASISAGIPSADDIALQILEKYSDNPEIQQLQEEDRVYSKLMNTLTPNQRNTFLKELIDKAQINVTHIYLAQMMCLGFIDYFLTVNFDNLMQRALALFNIFPPTYDISIFKDVTTTSFHPQSITYLHGQHSGAWLLNTEDEMDKVREIVPSRLDKITNGRTLIVLGYSGSDPIFDHLVKLGRFDNGLYWVGYKDNEPSKNVVDKLLDQPYSNAFLIKGYDADSFCLKLNSELGNPEPLILDKPFSFLQSMQNSIVAIEDSETYKIVKERLDNSIKMVNDAIIRYELNKSIEQQMTREEIKESLFKREVMNAIIKNDYSKADDLLERAKDFNSKEVLVLLSNLYVEWATKIINETKNLKAIESKQHFKDAFQRFDKAKELYPSNLMIYINSGYALNEYSKVFLSEEKKKILKKAVIEHETAIKLDPSSSLVYVNYGNTLGYYAKVCDGTEQLKYYLDSISKFERALELDKLNDSAYNNWGLALQDIAIISRESDAKGFYQQSFQKLEEAIGINPSNDAAYINWGTGLARYSWLLEKDKKMEYLNLSSLKFKKAIELKPTNSNAYYGYVNSLLNKAHLLKAEEKATCLNAALTAAMQAVSLGSGSYNLACVYALLGNKQDALSVLNNALINREISKEHVLTDEDWIEYRNDEDFKRMLNVKIN